MTKRFLTAFSAIFFLPGAALAHDALVAHTHSFMDGISHPLLGLDHLLAMISVGLWAAQRGGRAILFWPAAFMSAMALGGLLGFAGVALPLIEPAIAASLLVIGVMIAAARNVPMVAGMALIALFGLFHGNAHGLEAPATGDGALYALGFLISTATLHALGVGFGLAAGKSRADALVRVGALLIAVTGGVLLIA